MPNSRTDIPVTHSLPPGQRSRIVHVVVADAELAVTKRLSADPGTLGRAGDGRNIDLPQPLDVLAEAGGEPQHVGAGFQQKHRRRQEVAG